MQSEYLQSLKFGALRMRMMEGKERYIPVLDEINSQVLVRNSNSRFVMMGFNGSGSTLLSRYDIKVWLASNPGLTRPSVRRQRVPSKFSFSA